MRTNLIRLERGRDLSFLTLPESKDEYYIAEFPIARFAKDSPEANRLAAILATLVQQQFHWMCAPVYRDALAFYDSNDNLYAVLNICFGCDRMLTENQLDVAADPTLPYDFLTICYPGF